MFRHRIRASQFSHRHKRCQRRYFVGQKDRKAPPPKKSLAPVRHLLRERVFASSRDIGMRGSDWLPSGTGGRDWLAEHVRQAPLPSCAAPHASRSLFVPQLIKVVQLHFDSFLVLCLLFSAARRPQTTPWPLLQVQHAVIFIYFLNFNFKATAHRLIHSRRSSLRCAFVLQN